MKGTGFFLRTLPYSFLVVTVVLLAPGTGLMTLSVPDGAPLQGNAAIADYVHPEKKAHEEREYMHPDAQIASFTLAAPEHYGAVVAPLRAVPPSITPPSWRSARAPPVS